MTIYNTPKQRKYAFERAIKDDMYTKERVRRGMKKKMINDGTLSLSKCTQCNRYMERHTANLQIKNNRPNAPICIPCIAGYGRRTLLSEKELQNRFESKYMSKDKKNRLYKLLNSKFKQKDEEKSNNSNT